MLCVGGGERPQCVHERRQHLEATNEIKKPPFRSHNRAEVRVQLPFLGVHDPQELEMILMVPATDPRICTCRETRLICNGEGTTAEPDLRVSLLPRLLPRLEAVQNHSYTYQKVCENLGHPRRSATMDKLYNTFCRYPCHLRLYHKSPPLASAIAPGACRVEESTPTSSGHA